MDRLILVLLIASGIAALITYAAGRLSRSKKWIKYAPGILLMAISVYNYYLSRQPSEGFEDLGQFITALILFAAAIGGIITALFMDYIKSRKSS